MRYGNKYDVIHKFFIRSEDGFLQTIGVSSNITLRYSYNIKRLI